MKPLPNQQRAVLKREALLSAAIDDFTLLGFESATAKSIAARAGVATGTFYQYFENKNDILSVIARNRFDFLREQIQFMRLDDVSVGADKSDIHSIFREVLRFVYDFHAAAPELHQVLEQRRVVDPQLRQIMAEGEQVLRDKVLSFVRSYNLKNDLVVAQNLFAMGEGLIHSLVFSEHGVNAELAINTGAAMLAAFFISNI